MEGEAGVGAEEEGDALEIVLLFGEVFGLVHGVADGLDLMNVGGGVGGVFPTGGGGGFDGVEGDGTGAKLTAVRTEEGGNGGGAEAEVVAAFPVALVVLGVVAGGGVVGGFVVTETGGC